MHGQRLRRAVILIVRSTIPRLHGILLVVIIPNMASTGAINNPRAFPPMLAPHSRTQAKGGIFDGATERTRKERTRRGRASALSSLWFGRAGWWRRQWLYFSFTHDLRALPALGRWPLSHFPTPSSRGGRGGRTVRAVALASIPRTTHRTIPA